MRKLSIVLLSASVLLAGGIRDILHNKAPVKDYNKSVQRQLQKSNAIIVKYKKDFDITSLKIAGVKKIRPFKGLNKHLKDYNIAVIKLRKKADFNKILQILKSTSGIIDVEQNHEYKMEALPNDTLFDKEWHLYDPQAVGKDINVTGVWNQSTGSKNIVIAVLDSGTNLLHEDLKDNLYINEAEANGKPGVDDDGDGYVDDVCGYDFAYDMDGNDHPLVEAVGSHGTHVSGIIGAVGNNGKGVSGVNWHVKILPVKIMRPNAAAYGDDILEGLNYIIKLKDMGVNIVAVNASYGGYYANYDVYKDSAIKDAIAELGKRGIVFFSSAGNTDRNNDAMYYDYTKLPASYNLDNIISVAALTSRNDAEKSSYSNYGLKTVQIAAPGSDIWSTMNYIEGNESVDSKIFYDNFENGDGGWIKSKGSNWALTDSTYHSASYSLTDSPDGDYDDNKDVYIEKEFNLSAYKDKHIAVDFCLNTKIAWNDWFRVYFYDGKNWIQQKYYGNTHGWKCYGLPIDGAYKVDNFKVRFMLDTNGDGKTDDGVYLDDVKIGYYTSANAYASATGTSMASPVGAGAYGLLSSIYPDETMYERLSRIEGNGLKADFPITGVRLNVGMAVEGSVRPYILNTKEVNSFSGDKFTFKVENVKNPKVYVGDKEAKILNVNGDEITIDLPSDPQRNITVEDNGVKSSNTLYISKWKIHLRMPSMHYNGNDAAYDNGKIFVYGGEDFFGKNTNVMDVYDIANDSWKSGAAPDVAFDFATASAYDSKVYFVGGSDKDNNYLSNVKIYDSVNNSWSNGTALPEDIKFARNVKIDSSMYIFGGYTDSVKSYVYRYDMANDSFTKLNSMNEARELPAVCSFRGKIYIFGGLADNALKSAEVYDVYTQKSVNIADMPKALYGAECVDVNDSFIMIFGGLDENDTYNSDFIRYYPDENRYEVLSNTSYKPVLDVYDLTDKVVNTGEKLYLMGGMVKDSYVKGTSSFEDMNISEMIPVADTVDDNVSDTSSDTNATDSNTTSAEPKANVSKGTDKGASATKTEPKKNTPKTSVNKQKLQRILNILEKRLQKLENRYHERFTKLENRYNLVIKKINQRYSKYLTRLQAVYNKRLAKIKMIENKKGIKLDERKAKLLNRYNLRKNYLQKWYREQFARVIRKYSVKFYRIDERYQNKIKAIQTYISTIKAKLN